MYVQELWKRRDIELENRRREHEIKVDILLKMDETIMHQISKAQLLPSQKKIKSPTIDEQKALLEDINNWYTLEAKPIQSKLNTYFPETELGDNWDVYARTLLQFPIAVWTYLFESNPQDKVRPFTESIIGYVKSTYGEKLADDLRKQITSGFNTDTELMSEVIAMFISRSEYIKRDIMNARVKIF
jgi:hypothetical protein